MRKANAPRVSAALISAVALISFAIAAAGDGRPRVVRVEPKVESLDPAAQIIRFEFDQPMDVHGGYSVVGGGETFPALVGRPRWVDERTLLLQVRLKPAHEYRLSINNERFQGFRSKDGKPAVPYPLKFRTADAAATRPSKLTPEQNRAAVAELRRAIDTDYSYRERLKLEWDKLFAEARPALEAAATPTEFAQAAAKLLANAKDLHIWLEVEGPDGSPTGRPIASHRADLTPNLNLNTLTRTVPGWKNLARGVFAGKFEDGTRYLLIATWAAERAESIKAAIRFITEANDAAAFILDVRPNTGGAELLAQEVAACFVPKPATYARHRLMSAGKLSHPYDRTVQPKDGQPVFKGKVAVLMGPANMSSSESFLLMMKQVPGCKLIGRKSRGSSGNPQPVVLGNGVIVHLSSWQDLRPDGLMVEGEGVTPDVEVPGEGKAFGERDAVIEEALKRLQAR